MPAKNTSSSMLAKGAESGPTSTAPKPSKAASEGEPLLASEADPNATVDRILALLSEERYPTARRLAAAALARFPDHTRIRNAWSIFDHRGKATAGPEASDPNRDEEFEWLRDPPDSVRGKWVALLGHEMIGAAETLAELEKTLSASNLPKPALVHFIE